MNSSIWIEVAVIAVVTFALYFSFTRILPRLTRRTNSDFDDFLFKSLSEFVLPAGVTFAVAVAAQDLGLPAKALTGVDVFTSVVFVVLGVRLVNAITGRFLKGLARRTADDDMQMLLASAMPLLRSVVWLLGGLICLQRFGVPMTAVFTAIGGAGFGLAFALKEPLSELFAYVMILLDKPFRVGQFINVGSVWATVEKIGVRSTHLRNLRGEVIVMNNTMLTNSEIANFADMAQRRMIYRIGVTYSTGVGLMREIPSMIESIISSEDHVRFDRCHFVEFADSSLNFEIVYYIDTRDYGIALNAQQNINLEIMQTFSDRGIEFAFPSQTLYLEKSASDEVS
ncbi:mechanosensitive ion channel family protein [Parasynechococcus sp.]|uniref:mechanosensitive ion channel family protein n=1 Tax=Parasynechococcus sp. TaxID=3101203 RepID=UPI003704CEA0